MWTQNHQSGRQTGGASPVADPGERPGGPAPPAYLRVLITASPLLEGLYPPL